MIEIESEIKIEIEIEIEIETANENGIGIGSSTIGSPRCPACPGASRSPYDAMPGRRSRVPAGAPTWTGLRTSRS